MLSDCPECWDTPCTCGYYYKEWSIGQIKAQILMLQKVAMDKEQTIKTATQKKEVIK